MTGPIREEAAATERAGTMRSDEGASPEGPIGAAPPQWFMQVPAIGYVRRIHMSDPIRAGETTHISAEVERLLGYGPAEFRMDPDLWAARIHPDDLGRVFSSWRRASDVGSRYQLAYRMIGRDGRVVQVFDGATVDEEPGSRIRSWYGLVVDITA